MRSVTGGMVLGGVMVSLLALGGCATVDSVKRAQASADAAGAAAAHAQASADAAGSAAGAAGDAAKKAQDSADAAGASANTAGGDAKRANDRLDKVEHRVDSLWWRTHHWNWKKERWHRHHPWHAHAAAKAAGKPAAKPAAKAEEKSAIPPSK
jgi:hypothetical protein